MSSGKEIEAPHTLASLPHPIDATNGRTLAAGVSSLSGSKKRKRTEVAVAIDGEGISVYSVQTPRLITSYALPPQTYFTSPACSLYCKATKQRSARRFTYASIAQSASGNKPQILCFAEEIQQNATNAPEKFTRDLPPTSKRVLSIDVIPVKGSGNTQDELHDVVVIHEDGEISCFSADLKQTRWQVKLADILPSKDAEPISIEHSTLTNAETARRGLLKGREDIVAALDPSLNEQSELLEATQILCIVSRSSVQSSENTRTLHVLALRPRSTSAITTHRAAVQHLLAWPLPAPSSRRTHSDSTASYSLHAASGALYQLKFGAIVAYDLSGTVPRVQTELEPSESAIDSFTRLSSTLLLAASADFCALYDVKYNTLQAMLPILSSPESVIGGKKRKSSGSDLQLKSLCLVSYFSEIGLAVGLANNALVGIQIGSGVAPPRRNRTKGSLLVDAIGKGVGSSRVGPENTGYIPALLSKCVLGPSQKSDEDWKKHVVELDGFAKAQDIHGFEALFAAQVGIKREIAGSEESGVNGVKEESPQETSLPQWTLPKRPSDTSRLAQRNKAIYALGKIFAWSPSINGNGGPGIEKTADLSIAIRFFPPNVLQWLVWAGYLTKELVQKALHQSSPYSERARSINDGDIVTSLVNFDPEMRILYAILNQNSHLEISEIVQAIKLLIQSLDNKPLPHLTSHLLADGDALDATCDVDMQVESEVKAASEAIDHAMSTLEDGLLIRSQTLRPALTKLHSFPAQLITQSLRAKLTNHEIIFLIHLLRIELAEGGWASRYFDIASEPQGESGDPSDRAINIISSLLSCCLDAIGTGGWLAAAANSSSVDATDDLLKSLRLEISAALEGIHEATFMEGLLSEFLRYGWRKRHAPLAPTSWQLSKRGMPVEVLPESEELRMERNLLPLGLKAEGGIDQTKIGLGGEIKRKSKREVGMEISMRVPRYSFETIRI